MKMSKERIADCIESIQLEIEAKEQEIADLKAEAEAVRDGETSLRRLVRFAIFRHLEAAGLRTVESILAEKPDVLREKLDISVQFKRDRKALVALVPEIETILPGWSKGQ